MYSQHIITVSNNDQVIAQLSCDFSHGRMVFGAREMIASAVCLLLIMSIVASSGSARSSERKSEMDKNLEVIFNFNSETEFSTEDANRWYESSDTVRFVLTFQT